MGTLNDIVSVQIALNTAAVERADFGTQLIAAPLASFAERVRTYTNFDSENPDNLPPQVMTALAAVFAQTPHPNRVKVGRLSIDGVHIAPVDAVANAVYGLTLGNTPISVTAAASPTTASIATQIASAVNTAALGVTATADSGVVSLVFTGAIVPVTKFVKMQWVDIAPSAVANALTTDLGAIRNEDNTWYCLHMTERTPARILEAAAWTETQEKIFITAVQEAGSTNASSTTDTGYLLKNKQYFRTGWSYQKNANTEYPDVAWASRVLTIQPGSDTWALKRLAAVTPDKLTGTERTVVFGKNGNTFEYYQPSIALTNPGKVAAGEWIDIIRFRDYLKDLIQTNMVQLMINRDKVPYTDGGIQMLGNNLKSSLRTGQAVGGIAPDELDADGKPVPGFNVTIPISAEIDDVTKASRVVYFKFNARIAGAIHAANITGALDYSLD